MHPDRFVFAALPETRLAPVRISGSGIDEDWSGSAWRVRVWSSMTMRGRLSAWLTWTGRAGDANSGAVRIQKTSALRPDALEAGECGRRGVVKSAADVAPPVARPPPLPRAEPRCGDLMVEGVSRIRRSATGPLRTHAERVERLYRIIDRLLEKMESNMVNNPEHDSAGTGTRGEGADVDDDGDGAR